MIDRYLLPKLSVTKAVENNERGFCCFFRWIYGNKVKEKRRKMEEKNIQEIQRLHIQIEDILKRSLIFFKQY